MGNKHINQKFTLSIINNNYLDKPLIVVYLGADSTTKQPYLVGIVSKLSNKDLKNILNLTDYLCSRETIINWFAKHPDELCYFNESSLNTYDFYFWLDEIGFDHLEEISGIEQHIFLINKELDE